MTSPASAPRRKDAVATRGRLVRAALDLFTSQGYRGTTTLDIAARAAIAEATIYRHFTGKEALFNEVYREALRWGLGVIRATAEGDRPPPARERLVRIARRVVEHTQKDAALVMMLLRRPDGIPLEEPTQAALREFRETLTLVIASGKQEGAIRPGSAELWGTVWLALLTFVVERVAAKEWGPEHSSVAMTLDAAWDAIGQRAG